MENEFKRAGVQVEYILGEYPDTPEGQLSKNIRAVIAEFEREKINQRMTRGRRNVVKKGKVMLHSAPPPYGYRVKDGMLVIYEPETEIVRLIFTWYVVGDKNGQRLSINGIAVRLTEMKVPTWGDIHGTVKKKRSWGEWEAASVSNILNNEASAGVWHYGKRGKGRDYWLSTEVPAIVSREAWEKAQERKRTSHEMSRRNSIHEYLTGKRVVCGQCGGKTVGRLAKGRSRKHPYYCCPASTKQIANKTCDTSHFRADHVDRAAWEWVKSWLSDPEALRRGLEEQAEQMEANSPLYDRLAVLESLLADTQK